MWLFRKISLLKKVWWPQATILNFLSVETHLQRKYRYYRETWPGSSLATRRAPWRQTISFPPPGIDPGSPASPAGTLPKELSRLPFAGFSEPLLGRAAGGARDPLQYHYCWGPLCIVISWLSVEVPLGRESNPGLPFSNPSRYLLKGYAFKSKNRLYYFSRCGERG